MCSCSPRGLIFLQVIEGLVEICRGLSVSICHGVWIDMCRGLFVETLPRVMKIDMPRDEGLY